MNKWLVIAIVAIVVWFFWMKAGYKNPLKG